MIKEIHMIQDIFPHKLYNHYDPDSKPGPDSIVIALRGNDVLISGDLFPMVKDLPEISTDELVYLFSVDDENHYFLLDVDDIGDMKIPEGYEFMNVRKFRSMGFPKKYRVFVAFTALQLANWYRNNRFCGRGGISW